MLPGKWEIGQSLKFTTNMWEIAKKCAILRRKCGRLLKNVGGGRLGVKKCGMWEIGGQKLWDVGDQNPCVTPPSINTGTRSWIHEWGWGVKPPQCIMYIIVK